MSIATKEEIRKYLNSENIYELLDRMENYVRDRFYSKNEKDRNGLEYIDFCSDAIMKAINGTRNWNKDNCSFDEFIFGVLKSDLSNYFRKEKKKTENNKEESENEIDYSDEEIYLIEINEYTDLSTVESNAPPEDIDIDDITLETKKQLIAQGADDKELEVFECWLDNFYKPQEISDLCGITTSEVNNVIKRLKRRTVKLRKRWMILKK